MPDTPVKILYAEDDKDAARIYQIHLRRAGFQTDVVTDGLRQRFSFTPY